MSCVSVLKLSMRVPPTQACVLRDRARSAGVPVSEIIRLALQELEDVPFIPKLTERQVNHLLELQHRVFRSKTAQQRPDIDAVIEQLHALVEGVRG